MNKVNLGRSELLVSEIALGCMSLPEEKKEAQAIVDEAIESGIRYFDTADLYGKGQNEELVGQCLGNKRKDVILATKVGNQWDPNSDEVIWNPSANYIKSQVHESLRRLKTDYIDLYQLHGGMITDQADETIEAFESLKKEGLIREYGISSIRPNVIKRYLNDSSLTSVMMQYSLLDRRPEEFLDEIGKAGVSVVTRGTLAKGLLTPEALVRARESDGYLDYSQEELEKALKGLLSIETDLNALAIHSALSHPTVATVAAGASSPAQLRETVKSYNKHISPEQLEAARKLTKQSTYKDHRE